jgi:hypothetical protein
MLGEILGLSALVATNGGINIGIYRYFNARLAKVYERLDKVKEVANNEFVRKDMCKVLHEQTANNLEGSETRTNTRFDKLEEKMDRILSILTNKT